MCKELCLPGGALIAFCNIVGTFSTFHDLSRDFTCSCNKVEKNQPGCTGKTSQGRLQFSPTNLHNPEIRVGLGEIEVENHRNRY